MNHLLEGCSLNVGLRSVDACELVYRHIDGKKFFLDVPEDGINAAHYRGGGNIKQSLTPFMASTRPF